MAINNTCSYILFANRCDGIPANLTVIADQEFRHEDHAFIKSFRVKYGPEVFQISTNVSLNGKLLSLPYTSDNFQIYNFENYVTFDHPEFTIQYDFRGILKIRNCIQSTCGICNVKEETKTSPPYLDLLSREENCQLLN